MTRLLIVEVNPHIRANLVELLEQAGFEVMATDSARTGVALLGRERFAVALCDLAPEEINDRDLIDSLRAARQSTPVMFLSGRTDRSRLSHDLALDPRDCISKPFTPDDLVESIKQRVALEQRRPISSATQRSARTTPSTPGAMTGQLPQNEHRYGSYRVVAPLGRGGIGAVYSAEHVLIGKQAAIKVLLPELSQSRESVARFFHEARLAASITDPGIVDVFDFGYDNDGNAYIAMELLHGESLGAYLEKKPAANLSFISYVGRQIARVVGAAHAQHIIHRDLKPDNIFLTRDQDLPFGVRVKVLDFGMAKLGAGGGPNTIITEKGALLGTPLYMSPEQCRGLGEVDVRADVYALGCILYEMACGHPPFVKGGVGVIIGSHIYEPVPKPSALVPGISRTLEEILLRALEKDVEDRYQTMHDFASDLARLGGEHGEGRAAG